MRIVPAFSNDAISKRVQEFQKRVEKATLFQLQYLGEKLARYAKDTHSYTDRTGNLTNSIGYAVARGSKIVTFGGENQPGEGADNALAVAMQFAEQCSNTLSLIVVAGMNYVEYVEAKGYNVILPAELLCKTEFPMVIAKLQQMAKNKAQQLFGTTK